MLKARIHRVLVWFADFLVRHPIAVAGSLILSAFVALYLARNLEFDFTPQSIYRGSGNLLSYSEQFKQTFGYDDVVLLILLNSTGDNDALSVPALQWQSDVAHDLQTLKLVQRIDSIPTIRVPRFALSGLYLEDLIEEVTIDEGAADRARQLLSGSEMVRSGLLSNDDRVAGIAVQFDPSARDIEVMKAVFASVEAKLAQHPAPTGYQVILSGLPEVRVAIVKNLAKDMVTLVPMCAVVYLIVLGLMFRRVSGALLPLGAVGIGLTWTLATFAITHDSMNLVSNVLPTLLMIIGVSSCVQIVTCYSEQSVIRRDRRIAGRETTIRMAAPCFVVALTTAVGFASLFTARSDLLVRFGWQAALGILFQYISTMLTLGTMLRFFPAPVSMERDEFHRSLITRIVTALGYAVARHAWPTLGCAAVVIVAAAFMGSRVPVNSQDVGETFHYNDPSMISLRLVDEKLGGLMPLDVSLTATRPGAFLRPEIFHKIIQTENEVKQIPSVLVAQSYADLFREILRSWPGRRATESDTELVPLNETGSGRLERISDFVSRFGDAFHFDTFMTEDGMRARIRMRLKEIGSREALEIIHKIETVLAKTFPPEGEVKAQLTGEGYVNALALTVLIRDLYYSLLTASLVIFTLITVEFRSLRTGMIAAIPNLTPLAITLGYMGLRGYPLNVANVIAFTICLGLADDNTVYFLYRFRQEMAIVHEPVEAVRRTFLGTGRAIVLTSILLLVGMAVLLCSGFLPTQRFAELTSVTIFGNLMGVLLLLPACLVLFGKKTDPKPVKHAAERNLSAEPVPHEHPVS